MLKAAEIDSWRRAAGKSRIERVPNDQICKLTNIMHVIGGGINNKELI